jgi:hypothetical protein
VLLLQVHLLDPEKPGQPRRLQTEGINFSGVWQQQGLLDVNAIACNDVHAMLTTYGVEAARATILREAQVCAGLNAVGLLLCYRYIMLEHPAAARSVPPCVVHVTRPAADVQVDFVCA